MRELTKTEIENAPDWCDKYIILANEVFYTDGETQTTGNGCRTHPLFFANDERLKPIPRKEFDISKYEFGEFRFIGLDENGDVELRGRYRHAANCINKKDAIALAKHFKLID